MSKPPSYHKTTKKASSLSLPLVDSSTHLSSKPFRPRSSRGFTIVELLIVIVVIGILAAISVVAYNGISNNANDAAIKNDLANLGKKIEMIKAETGEYPAGGGVQTSADITSGNSTAFPGVSFKPSKGAYFTASGNLSYCTGTIGGVVTYRLVARSKSGETFAYSPGNGLVSLGKSVIDGSSACTGVSYPRTWSYGYYQAGNSWWSWTN